MVEKLVFVQVVDQLLIIVVVLLVVDHLMLLNLQSVDLTNAGVCCAKPN